MSLLICFSLQSSAFAGETIAQIEEQTGAIDTTAPAQTQSEQQKVLNGGVEQNDSTLDTELVETKTVKIEKQEKKSTVENER